VVIDEGDSQCLGNTGSIVFPQFAPSAIAAIFRSGSAGVDMAVTRGAQTINKRDFVVNPITHAIGTGIVAPY
jgi:hypothetical protein